MLSRQLIECSDMWYSKLYIIWQLTDFKITAQRLFVSTPGFLHNSSAPLFPYSRSNMHMQWCHRLFHFMHQRYSVHMLNIAMDCPPSLPSDINECASSPCLNGGTCVDEVNQFSCICTKGWAGVTCQSPVPTCKYKVVVQFRYPGFGPHSCTKRFDTIILAGAY